MNIDKYTYRLICDRNSDKILQRIICPYCGTVYSHNESIDLGISDDCEDEVVINCKQCKNKIVVHSIVTEPRFWTTKYKE